MHAANEITEIFTVSNNLFANKCDDLDRMQNAFNNLNFMKLSYIYQTLVNKCK